jgi:predicted transposase YdaD
MLRRDLLEMVETICIYKFPRLTRKEVETMFNLIEIQDTKVYQEAFEEGKLEGIEMVLDSKFGIEGLHLMPEIRNVKDINILETIIAALMSAKTIEEVRSIYQQ